MREVLQRDIKKVPTLRGKTVITVFYEASTRTRVSFEQAGKILSADVINVSGSGSSVEKGESLYNTALTLQAMNADIIVIRHPHSGAPHFLARFLNSAVINAGDGMHAHPTQALARPVHNQVALRQGRRLEGRHSWRPAVQPRGALQPLGPHDYGRECNPLRSSHADTP